jgi:hypothetical protein
MRARSGVLPCLLIVVVAVVVVLVVLVRLAS